MEKAFYLAIFLALVITITLNSLSIQYYMYKIYLLLFLLIYNSTFLILGFLASIVSLSLYNIFYKSKEISTINFMLSSKKFKEEIKFFHYLAIITFIGWTFALILYLIYLFYPELGEEYELILSLFHDLSYMFSSILLAIGTIVVLYRWRKRVSAYA
jgi:hypothetical protein